jgi:heptosyltransferase-2
MDDQNILVIMLGGVGNAIMTLPLLHSLQGVSHRPRVTALVAESTAAFIFKQQHVVDDVIEYVRPSRESWDVRLNFIQTLRRKRFDVALITSHTNPIKAGLLCRLAGIPVAIGQARGYQGVFLTHRINLDEYYHEVDGNLALLKPLAIKPTHIRPVYDCSNEATERIDDVLKDLNQDSATPLVAFHVGSGALQSFKRWSKAKYIEVAQRLISRYHAYVVFTGSSIEVPLVNECLSQLNQRAWSTAGSLSLDETAALLKRCDLLISNDSGIAHLAAAVDTPLLVLFGPTDIRRIVPRGKRVEVVKKLHNGVADLECLSVDDVMVKVNEVLAELGYRDAG